ncbi:cobyrinic acid a,c-diamide synthase [Rippkaea orientalis PCC 8801]|uniref:Cobyrinate a,c-diamide synthase n=1 Tax=Rippkaea orientalis (strain PCC 8801 / RF-1) TaxID=41431 RepID=B7JUE8_RIPO1|nr:cobyrinate a,c-diamide synthase [Rippkaea orientalis]ACK64528.1 cobyrinic acid a,c-diamide synthase [Rippkaea orientalis PCC 8801]
MALIIAGDRSGVGKTTITLALLSFLVSQKHRVQSFKVGPDYIDPMFHTAITGRPCRNLDPILTSESYVQACFTQHCQGVDYALVEGVMGLFDGIPFTKSEVRSQKSEVREKWEIESFYYGSTAHIARLLDIPVLLVIDCSRLSGSVAAIAHGYRSLDPKLNIVGVILNRVGSDRHHYLLQQSLESLNIPILGTLSRQDSLTIPDRHLGLVPTTELPHLQPLFKQLSHLAKKNFNWDLLLPLLTPPPSPPLTPSPSPPLTPIRLALASDRAFNFYYQDNLDHLETLGIQLIPWSPLRDATLPPDIHGLYFGGGFPEMFAEELSSNLNAVKSVKTAIAAGIPTYAECGGLMYLCDQLIDFQGQTWPMVGILPTTAMMGSQLTLGYRQATALENTPLLNKGTTLWGHEFHRSSLSNPPLKPLFSLTSWHYSPFIQTEGWVNFQVHASYIHLHFAGCPSVAKKFFSHCLDFFKQSKLS